MKRTKTETKNNFSSFIKTRIGKPFRSSCSKKGNGRFSSVREKPGFEKASKNQSYPLIRYEKKINGPHFRYMYRNQEILVIGTAHISRESVNDVRMAIQSENPDLVCVELCQARYSSIMDRERWRKLDIVQVIKQRKVYLLMSSLILSSFQKQMGEYTKVKPGEEIMTAISLAKRNRLPFELVDRDVQITLRRAWQGIGFFNKMFLASELIASLIVSPQADDIQIEEMKRKDILEGLFENLPTRYQKIKRILITERDMYLAQKIKHALLKHPKAYKAVAVVGAGHLKGIKKYLNSKINLAKLEFVQQKSWIWGAIKFIIPILIIMGLFFHFTDMGDTDAIRQNILSWIGIKAFCSGVLALILLAHPFAILAAAITAPISNFNPILKPGWVAALIEAKYHKPQVSDFENLSGNVKSLKGFFKNKVIRIFTIFTLPQIGSSIGTALAFWYIA
jgi:pheromone shutdown-related protein TraB